MANTFAEHILGLAGRGNVPVSTDTCPEAEPVAAESSAPDAISSSADSASNAKALTYASVVLMMAMGTHANTAQAATEGALATGGASSTGSVGISMSIPERIDVQGLRSVALAADGAGAFGQVSGCISGHGSSQYRLAVMESASESMALSYAAGGDEARPLTMGQALQQLHGAGAQGCAQGASNATLSVRLPATAVQRGALTLVISPE